MQALAINKDIACRIFVFIWWQKQFTPSLVPDGFAQGLPAARHEEASVCKLLLTAVSNFPLSPYCSGELSLTRTKMTTTCPSRNPVPKLVIRPDTGDFSSGKHQLSARSGVAAHCVYNLLYSLKTHVR